MTCMKNESSAEGVKHHLYLSNNESQSAKPNWADAGGYHRKGGRRSLLEKSDFESFTADGLL